MTTLRAIEPISTKGLTLAPIPDQPPKIVWVGPRELVVDGTYQRELSERSRKVLIRAIEGFSWARFKLPIAVKADGALHLIDGQHSAIAAATREIAKIPVCVVTADTLDDRARAFVGHNRDRTPVSPIDIYRALLTSGDLDAQDVDRVCRRAGIRIRNLSPSSAIAEGDTSAVGVVRRLVKNRGVRKARQTLEVLVKAHRAPVTGADILASEAIFCGATALRPDADPAALAKVIEADGDEGPEAARIAAKRVRMPFYQALAQRWLRRLDETTGTV